MDIRRESTDSRVTSDVQSNISEVQNEPPVIGGGPPRRVPPSVRAKMQYLEKPKNTSKGCRILERLGYAAAGVGVALLLASNPVGWGVAATMVLGAAVVAVGTATAGVGTYKTIKADIYRADVKAYEKSLAQPGANQEQASAKTRARIVVANVAEGLAYGVAGFFGAAGIGAAFKAQAFTMFGSHQASAATFGSAKTLLPIYWGTASVVAAGGGMVYDHKRTKRQGSPRVDFEQHVTNPLQVRTTGRRDSIPQSSPLKDIFLQQSQLASDKVDEAEAVTVRGPLVLHDQQTNGIAVPPTHAPGGGPLPGQHPRGQMQVEDNEVMWHMARQTVPKMQRHVMSSRYQTVPINGDLFADGPPKLGDIRQSLKRANCYMAGAIASVLVRPNGWKKIEDIMQDNGETVTVRLKGADVTVPKTRIVTTDGYDAFNAGADWVHILEKALSVYLLKDPQSEVGVIDYGRYMHVVDQLAHTLGGPDQSAGDLGALQAHLDRGTNVHNERWKPDWEGIIDRSLESGHVVAFSTDDKNMDQRILQRVLAGHVYPIVGTATRDNAEGYLVYDGYGSSVGWDGESLGAFPTTTLNDGNVLTYDRARRGSGPVFFVSKDEMGELFDNLLHEPSDAPSLPVQNDGDNQVENTE